MIDRLFPATWVSVRGGDSIRRQSGGFLVELRSGRSQRIVHELDGQTYRFTTQVAGPDVIERLGLSRVASDLLLWNRETPIVTFGVDDDRSVIAWISQRAETMQQEELLFYLTELAHEADRVEGILTGEDVW